MDLTQFGNQYGLSIQHYLVKMIHKILSDTYEGNAAVIATFVDWKDAFPNQCPALGIKAFIDCGVRPSLIPVLISYFQGRSLVVKWHGKESKKQNVPGGGPQGAYLGNLEYLAQSNENANCVKEDSRYKFVDDLTALVKINLLLLITNDLKWNKNTKFLIKRAYARMELLREEKKQALPNLLKIECKFTKHT